MRPNIDSFFDELLNVSEELTKQSNAPVPTPKKVGLSGKGALIGGALGAGLGGIRAIGRETHERAADDRAGLTDEQKKILRKKRLAGHAANILAWSGAGSGIGSLERKARGVVGEAGEKVWDSIDYARAHADEVVADARKHADQVVADAHARANQTVHDAPKNFVKGIGHAAANAGKRVGRGIKSIFTRKPKV